MKDASKEFSVLSFRLGENVYAFPVHLIARVILYKKAQTLPRNTRKWILGILGDGATLYPCASLHVLLGQEQSAPTNESRVLIVELGGKGWAFPVDEVMGLASLSEIIENKGEGDLIFGLLDWDGHKVHYLDEKGLLRRLLSVV